MEKIAIVEDEQWMRQELQCILEKEGYQVAAVTDFEDTSVQITAISPDLVLLDLNLPMESGFEICKSLRKHTTLPILVLTSRDNLRDELHALGLGADEYLTKPCHKERLLARITNLLRRNQDRKLFVEEMGMKLDIQTYTLYVEGSSSVLSENQGKMLALLLKSGQEPVTKEKFVAEIWGGMEYIDENAFSVNMTRLKKVLGNITDNYKIVTLRGRGYYLTRIEDQRK